MPSCGYCHHKDGTHSKGCKKTACKICAKMAPKKCGFHSGQGGKPGPKGPRIGKPAGQAIAGAAIVVSDRTRIKAAIAEHDRKAAALREALAILESA